MRKMIRGIAAVLAVSALMAGTAMAGNPKLEVKGTDGTTSVFKVEDDGITTIANKTAADTNYIFELKDLSGTQTFGLSGSGFMNQQGNAAGQHSIINFVGTAGVQTNLPNARPVFEAYRVRGSKSSPAAVMTNDKLGTFGFAGYDGSGAAGVYTTGKISGALLEVFVDGPVTTGSVPQRMSIVTGTSSSNRAERLVIKNDGKIGVGTNAPTNILHIAGNSLRIDTARTPSGACNPGEISWDDNKIYVCISTGAWKSATLQ